MRRPSLRAAWTGGLAGLLLVAAGCLPTNGPLAGIPAGAADGLYPQIVITGARSRTAELRLSLLEKPAGARIGSFRGEIRYDPAVLILTDRVLAGDAEGDITEMAPGRVRFRGTSLDGVGESPLVTLRFERNGLVAHSSVGVVFEQVAHVDSADVTASVHADATLISVR